jgi:arylsulfatase A-like enzyme
MRKWTHRLLPLLALTITASAQARPNFPLIFPDDHGYGDVSTYGASDVRTPHIDRIAREGMLFTTMRGEKQEHSEGGLRVPFMIRRPAGIKTGSCSDDAGLVSDLFPTIVELARGKAPEDPDAISLVPLLRGDWKLLRNDPAGQIFAREQGKATKEPT